MKKTKIIAVDPGMATGMAVWDDCNCPGRDKFRVTEIAEPFQVQKVLWLSCVSGDLTEIAVEDFHLSFSGRAMTSEGAKVTIELIGAIKFIAAWHDVPLYMQWPEDARDFSTNEKLAAMGWTTPSKPDHMRSAARHLLLRLVRNGTVDGVDLLNRLL